jgi:hypothetical protein
LRGESWQILTGRLRGKKALAAKSAAELVVADRNVVCEHSQCQGELEAAAKRMLLTGGSTVADLKQPLLCWQSTH